MESFNKILSDNIGFYLIGLTILIVILLTIVITLSTSLKRLRKKYEHFMLGATNENVTLEELLISYLNETRTIERQNLNIKEKIAHLEQKTEKCFQKISIIRYNPFDDMGGNLCYAVALLDENNNGLVLNGIHTRTSSYSYAKPVINGKSDYKLSSEEEEAIHKAITQ